MDVMDVMDITFFAILCPGKYLIKSTVKILVETLTKLNSNVCIINENVVLSSKDI